MSYSEVHMITQIYNTIQQPDLISLEGFNLSRSAYAKSQR